MHKGIGTWERWFNGPVGEPQSGITQHFYLMCAATRQRRDEFILQAKKRLGSHLTLFLFYDILREV